MCTQKQSVNLQRAKRSSCRKEKGNVNYDDLFNEIRMATAQVWFQTPLPTKRYSTARTLSHKSAHKGVCDKLAGAPRRVTLQLIWELQLDLWCGCIWLSSLFLSLKCWDWLQWAPAPWRIHHSTVRMCGVSPHTHTHDGTIGHIYCNGPPK